MQYNYRLYIRLQDLRKNFNIIRERECMAGKPYKMVSEYFLNAELVAVVDNYM